MSSGRSATPAACSCVTDADLPPYCLHSVAPCSVVGSTWRSPNTYREVGIRRGQLRRSPSPIAAAACNAVRLPLNLSGPRRCASALRPPAGRAGRVAAAAGRSGSSRCRRPERSPKPDWRRGRCRNRANQIAFPPEQPDRRRGRHDVVHGDHDAGGATDRLGRHDDLGAHTDLAGRGVRGNGGPRLSPGCAGGPQPGRPPVFSIVMRRRLLPGRAGRAGRRRTQYQRRQPPTGGLPSPVATPLEQNHVT